MGAGEVKERDRANMQLESEFTLKLLLEYQRGKHKDMKGGE